MEKNYVVMTDSSADLNPALEQELGVDIIPLSVNCGDRTFLDYPDEREIKTSEFYGMLRSGANAKTAAANVETFLTAMSRHLEQGKDVLYLGFSSGLSSTYSASEIAAQELRERYPERKVLTVDTLCASMGQGLLVWLTVQELKHGATLEEAAKYAEDNRLHLCHWFTVDDLFFLKRGGRVSAATALVGSALGIKPVLHVDNEGHLINVSKARGRKNSILALVDRMERSHWAGKADRLHQPRRLPCRRGIPGAGGPPPPARPAHRDQLRRPGHRRALRSRHTGAVLPRNGALSHIEFIELQKNRCGPRLDRSVFFRCLFCPRARAAA